MPHFRTLVRKLCLFFHLKKCPGHSLIRDNVRSQCSARKGEAVLSLCSRVSPGPRGPVGTAEARVFSREGERWKPKGRRRIRRKRGAAGTPRGPWARVQAGASPMSRSRAPAGLSGSRAGRRASARCPSGGRMKGMFPEIGSPKESGWS